MLLIMNFINYIVKICIYIFYANQCYETLKSSKRMQSPELVWMITSFIEYLRVNGERNYFMMIGEVGSPDCRVVTQAKRSIEDALIVLDGLPHTDHLRRQLLSVYNQLEGMHDLKRAGGAGVSFRSSDWCSKTTDVLPG